jgi:hypothetical protein
MTAASHFRQNVLKRDQGDFAPVDRRDPSFDLRGPRFVNRFIDVGIETVDQRGGDIGTLRFGQAERTSQDLFGLCAHVIRSRQRTNGDEKKMGRRSCSKVMIPLGHCRVSLRDRDAWLEKRRQRLD